MTRWRYDQETHLIISNYQDYLSLEEFIMYVNGLERELARRTTVALAAGYQPAGEGLDASNPPQGGSGVPPI